MKTEEEVQAKYEELNKRMSKMEIGDMFGTASTDGQRYILEWVLGHHG